MKAQPQRILSGNNGEGEVLTPSKPARNGLAPPSRHTADTNCVDDGMSMTHLAENVAELCVGLLGRL